MSDPIHGQCEGNEINRDKPKSNEVLIRSVRGRNRRHIATESVRLPLWLSSAVFAHRTSRKAPEFAPVSDTRQACMRTSHRVSAGFITPVWPPFALPALCSTLYRVAHHTRAAICASRRECGTFVAGRAPNADRYTTVSAPRRQSIHR